MADFKHVCSLGAGVIGASWTALFLASGRTVAVYDPAPGAEKALREYVARAWPTLVELGLAEHGNPDAIRFHRDAKTAVQDADFIQESVPERVELKHALFAEIQADLKPGAILASSASGLTLSEMQGGWRDPARFVLGHPFNPPHLIPLVEVMGNDRTDPAAISDAEGFYQTIGKITIRVNREVPGHVANRLQAAVWREAIHLVREGVASVEDVDKAMWAGPGLRWAAMGPTTLFHLGAGAGGLEEFCTRYADSFNRWWDDLGTPHLDTETARMLVNGMKGQDNPAEMSARRDALITAMQKATRGLR
ncbi:MAG: 3-hydroxyacyl-CoA dehydrogenase [Nioella sp.]|nr:3-hydroxyacyl-CoA dehydrogenase [Nioella sp.]HBQ17121.1 3-hydroxyacyl-CoA dehydrogenase [Myxococcales bacterium]